MEKIGKSTYFIKGGTNTGIYVYGDKAVIIDPGLAGARPKRILKKLEEYGFEVSYILNTHEHDDHYGGCGQIKDKEKSIINVSSEYAKLYIENPILFPTYIMGGNSCDIMNKTSKLTKEDLTIVDKTISEGILDLNTGENFKDDGRKLEENEIRIVELKGHTEGSLGFITSDNIFFVGDLLIGDEMISKFDFLFIFDVEEYLNSLEKLKSINYDKIVLGHSKSIIDKKESLNLIEKNKSSVEKYLNQLKEILSKEKIGYDKILKNLIINNNLKCNYKEYHFFKSSLVSLLTYLMNKEEVDYIIKNGELLYFLK